MFLSSYWTGAGILSVLLNLYPWHLSYCLARSRHLTTYLLINEYKNECGGDLMGFPFPSMLFILCYLTEKLRTGFCVWGKNNQASPGARPGWGLQNPFISSTDIYWVLPWGSRVQTVPCSDVFLQRLFLEGSIPPSCGLPPQCPRSAYLGLPQPQLNGLQGATQENTAFL